MNRLARAIRHVWVVSAQHVVFVTRLCVCVFRRRRSNDRCKMVDRTGLDRVAM